MLTSVSMSISWFPCSTCQQVFHTEVELFSLPRNSASVCREGSNKVKDKEDWGDELSSGPGGTGTVQGYGSVVWGEA